MRSQPLEGIIVSLVTHFTEDLALDEDAIVRSVDYYARVGAHGVCIAGGTGEALSLSEEEYRRAVDAALRGADGRAYVVAGALYTDPRRIVDCCRYARSAGAAAVMLIPPYFVRPSRRQIEEHFRRIAEAVEIPLILFNTPSRSGSNLEADLIVALARDCPNIVGVKEASGDMAKISRIVSGAGPDFSVLQGLDELVFPTLALGGKGALISLATLLPRLYVEMYERAQAGDYGRARELQFKVLDYTGPVYAETNPVGLKRMLELLGRPGGPPRPPLYPISLENEVKLQAIVADLLALDEAVAV
jgi:4-hydroxy-tetrahydrodipicolinate synthase